MGIVRYTVRGRAGHTGCEGTDWQSETSVRCSIGYVTSVRTIRLMFTVGVRLGSVSNGFSVDFSLLSVSRRKNSPRTGSVSITLHGVGFGLALSTARSRIGISSCESTGWESETSMRCLTGPQGESGTQRAVISIGQGAGSRSQGWSADVACLSLFIRKNVATVVSTLVTLHGTGMGLTMYTGKFGSLALDRKPRPGCQTRR